MKERPIIFSGPMVRALLAGTKTQTRRVAPIRDLSIRQIGDDCVGWGVHFTQPIKGGTLGSHSGGKFSELQARSIIASQFNPYGQPGDRLWVRETWCLEYPGGPLHYRASWPADALYPEPIWKPSIHMPRWASRITLEIAAVRVERLQDISEGDAIAEGWPKQTDPGTHTGGNGGPFDWYRLLWESINGPGSWDANPWVWVVEFRRVQP